MITMKIIIMFLVLIPVIAFSQETVTPFEFEVAIGPNWGIQKQKGEDVRTGLNVFMEMRYNYKACFDFGMQLFVGAYERLNNNDNSETIYRNVIIQRLPIIISDKVRKSILLSGLGRFSSDRY